MTRCYFRQGWYYESFKVMYVMSAYYKEKLLMWLMIIQYLNISLYGKVVILSSFAFSRHIPQIINLRWVDNQFATKIKNILISSINKPVVIPSDPINIFKNRFRKGKTIHVSKGGRNSALCCFLYYCYFWHLCKHKCL